MPMPKSQKWYFLFSKYPLDDPKGQNPQISQAFVDQMALSFKILKFHSSSCQMYEVYEDFEQNI